MRGRQSHRRERDLRRAQTEAESVLWQHLRGRRLLGFKFRRQHRIGPYFADFACCDAGLIVEVDGSQHLMQSAHDRRRTHFLQQRGYRVVRFWNDAVLRDTFTVLEAITIALAPHPPCGHLLPAGGEKD
jgi:very-short-patch-repair endonuclease